jgi:hypothetical protein
MDQITQSLSDLTLFVDDSSQSSASTFRMTSLVHTCRLLHHRNDQLCRENERLKKQIQHLLETVRVVVAEPNVCVPNWIK